MEKGYLLILIFISLTGSVFSQEYSDFVKSVIQQVNLDTLVTNLRELTGEDSVKIGDSTVLIRNRREEYGNNLAADYITQKLRSFGLEVKEQKYSETGKNIYAVQEGNLNKDKQVIICAHYDSVNDYAADDNGSGTIGVLEAARLLSQYQLDFTVVYALWDEEEWGAVGSQYYADLARKNGDNISAVFNLEMFGWDSNDDGEIDIHVDNIVNSAFLGTIYENIIQNYNLNLVPVIFNPGTTASDHAPFWENQYSAVVISQAFFGSDRSPYYHTAEDRIDKFNLSYFKELVKLSVGALAAVASGDVFRAYFASSTTKANVPYNASFFDQSFGKITSWEWDFNNDGIIDSYEQNPEWEYTQPGVYSVKLKISDGINSEEIVREDYITVFNGETALGLDGENYSYIDPIPEINLIDDFTIEFVFNPISMRTILEKNRLLDKGAIHIYGSGIAFGPKSNYSIIVDVQLEDSTEVTICAPDSILKIDQWEHIALTYQSSLDELKMFVHGREVETKRFGDNLELKPLLDNSTANLNIGSIWHLRDGIVGSFDELRLWSRVLSPEDIQENFDKYLTGDENGLTGYWNLNEANGYILKDKSQYQNDGYLAKGQYVQGVDLAGLTSLERSKEELFPLEFKLEQNYPNPFNPSTKIKFSTAKENRVNISIYNILGEQIAVLTDEIYKAGSHEIQFNASELSSGVYFYQMRSGEYVNVKKLILLK